MSSARTATRRGVVLALLPAVLGAQAFNGGIPSGYVCTGTCGVSGADGVVPLAPGGGSQFGFVTTMNAPERNPLGIENTVNGTTLLSSPFAATAGQNLSFLFDYVTSDGTSLFPDYTYVRLLGGDTPVVLFTARTVTEGNTVPGFGLPGIAPGVTLTPSTTPIHAAGFGPPSPGPVFAPLGPTSGLCFGAGCGFTDWITAQFMIAVAGNYQLEFGVFNAGDDRYDSALAFDFALGSGGVPIVGPPVVEPPVSAVPEPASLSLLATGLVGVLASAGRRLRRSAPGS